MIRRHCRYCASHHFSVFCFGYCFGDSGTKLTASPVCPLITLSSMVPSRFHASQSLLLMPSPVCVMLSGMVTVESLEMDNPRAGLATTVPTAYALKQMFW